MNTIIRKTSTRGLLCAATILSGLAWNAAAYAQTAPEPSQDASALEDVIVTARKSEERLQDVPLTINALTSDTIEELQIRSIFDLVQVTPGIYFGTTGGRNGGNKLQIRNFSTGTAGPSKASVFIDGIYSPEDYASIPLANLERIEVLKGPQSAYFGRATFVGAVNFVTRDPGDVFAGTLDFVQATEGEHDYTGYIDLPIAPGLLTGQLTYRDYEFEGPEEWRTTDGYHLGAQSTRSGSFKTVFTPTENLTIRTNVTHVSDDDGPPPVLYADPRTRTPQARALVTGQPQTFGYYFNGPVELDYAAPAWGLSTAALTDGGIRHELNRASLSYEWDVNDYTISGYVSRTQEEYHEQLDGNFYFAGTSPVTVPNAFGVPTTVTFAAAPLNYFLETKDTQAEIRVTSPQDRPLRYTLGYNYTKVQGPVRLSNTGGTTIFYSGAYGGSFLNPFENNSVFGGVYWDPTDQITVSLEGRYQREVVKGITYGTTPTNFGQVLTNFEQEYTAFLPRVNVQYRVNDNLQFYAVYAEGNNPGGFQPITPAQAAAVGIAYGYEEEELKNYEIGVKSTLFDGRVILNGAIYHADFTNEQLAQTTPVAGTPTGFASLYQPGVESEINGFEAELQAAVTSEFQIRGTVSYGKAEYVSFCSAPYAALTGVQTGLNCRSVEGFQHEGTPAFQSSLGGDWEHEMSNGFSVYARGEWLYQSKVFNEEWNQSWVPEHSTFNARAGIQSDRWTFEGFVRNAADDENTTRMTRVTDGRIGAAYTGAGAYPTLGGFSQQIAGQQTVAGTAKKPRQFGVRLAVRF